MRCMFYFESIQGSTFYSKSNVLNARYIVPNYLSSNREVMQFYMVFFTLLNIILDITMHNYS